MSPGPEILTLWGVADDGAAAAVVLPARFADLLAPRWPPLGLTRVTQPPSEVVLTLEVVVAAGALTVLMNGVPSVGGWERVESELALFASERLAGLVAVHAGVVEAGGRVLVIPGSSGVGKSTLCAAAASLGARVLSDEYALVDPTDGTVRGWRRPVRLRRPQGGVDLVDITQDSAPLPVGLVAMVTYRRGLDGAGDWHTPTQGDVVLELMGNTVCATSRPDEALDAALLLARTTAAVAGDRGEAPVAAAELLALLAERAQR